MSNVISLSSRRRHSTANAYFDGRNAAREMYLPDLQTKMSPAWAKKERFIHTSYSCPVEDPLHRLACLPDYRRGVLDVLGTELPRLHMFMLGPEWTERIEIVVCFSRFEAWSMRMVLAWIDAPFWRPKPSA